MTLGWAFLIIVGFLCFISMLLWLSRLFWPDMYDDYETLEWDDDVKGQLGD